MLCEPVSVFSRRVVCRCSAKPCAQKVFYFSLQPLEKAVLDVKPPYVCSGVFTAFQPVKSLELMGQFCLWDANRDHKAREGNDRLHSESIREVSLMVISFSLSLSDLLS